jgi:hypothetical protein
MSAIQPGQSLGTTNHQSGELLVADGIDFWIGMGFPPFFVFQGPMVSSGI